MIRCNFPFLFFLFSCVCSVTTLAQSMSPESPSEPEKVVDIQNYLKKINKPAVKTINSPDGDFIDCILFDQQPAFDHPRLRGHNPTMDPPEMPKAFLSDNNNTFEDEEVVQLWRMSGDSCPENTIPIRRTTEEDVLRAGSVQEFGRKGASRLNIVDNPNLHEHAIVYTKRKGEFYGAEAFINVWSSKVENPREFSLGQIWVSAGTHGDGDLNSVEVGSIVHYGEKYPRLFVYWTRDAYKHTGCYDMLCQGFIQIKSGGHIALGAALEPVSTYNGKQLGIAATVWKAPVDGNWWLAVQGKPVGYWPSELFSLLRDHADQVHFGGEIINLGSQYGRHTSTQMGSGHFPNEGFRKAAYIRNLQIVNSRNQLFSARGLINTFNVKPKCYRAQIEFGKKWGAYMYYGGAGRDASGCA